MAKARTLILSALGVTGAIAAGAFFGFAAPILKSGSGFSAKQICSGHFLSGLPGQMMVDEALNTASPILGATSFVIDDEAKTVETRLYGMFKRKAVFDADRGCTLLPIGTDQPPARPTAAAHAPAAGLTTGPEDAELTAIIARAFEETDPEAPLNTKAVVVVKDGQVIAELYADGVTKDTPLIGWSMTKSVTSMILGLLAGEGKIDIAAPAPIAAWAGDERSAITTDQLLRMSSGLAFEEDYGIQTDVTLMLTMEPDMAAFAAAMPLEHEPDTHWSYSSGTSLILSRIAQDALGEEPLDAYAQSRLFDPLGIDSAVMEYDASGTFAGSSYMYATARDWTKLGMLVLQDGRWNGQQVLPEGWINYATTPTPTNSDNRYGAQFWLNNNPDDPAKARAFPALPEDVVSMEGYQGQYVIVVPSEQLVVVRMGFTPEENHGVEQMVVDIIAHN